MRKHERIHTLGAPQYKAHFWFLRKSKDFKCALWSEKCGESWMGRTQDVPTVSLSTSSSPFASYIAARLDSKQIKCQFVPKVTERLSEWKAWTLCHIWKIYCSKTLLRSAEANISFFWRVFYDNSRSTEETSLSNSSYASLLVNLSDTNPNQVCSHLKFLRKMQLFLLFCKQFSAI